jgi:hypothetical protein
MMMHCEAYKPGHLNVCLSLSLINTHLFFSSTTQTVFLTITSTESNQVSLASHDTIPVINTETNTGQIIYASQGTLKHRLITWNRTIAIESIVIDTFMGCYSPLTLSGYVFINNISTSPFPDSSTNCSAST